MIYEDIPGKTVVANPLADPISYRAFLKWLFQFRYAVHE
jgi:hypothetical protein